MPSKKTGVKAIGAQQFRNRILWMATFLFGGIAASIPAAAQQQQAHANLHFGAPEMAVTYDVERAQVANVGCGCFWLQGGSVDMAVPFYKGLSIAGRFGGEHASNVRPGVDLNEVSYLAGPRYIFWGQGAANHIPQIFGHALFGGVHGFDGTFPVAGVTAASANSYAMQFGGGADVAISRGLGIRLVEVDYVRTALPNNGSNTQNNLRLAFGLTYHF